MCKVHLKTMQPLFWYFCLLGPARWEGEANHCLQDLSGHAEGLLRCRDQKLPEL